MCVPNCRAKTSVIRKMPHRTRPMTALLVFTGLNVVLVSTITPVYDFVCFHPYWERRVFNSLSIILLWLLYKVFPKKNYFERFIYYINGLIEK